MVVPLKIIAPFTATVVAELVRAIVAKVEGAVTETATVWLETLPLTAWKL